MDVTEAAIDNFIRLHFKAFDPGSNSEERRRRVEQWLAERTVGFSAVALALIARLWDLLRRLETAAITRDGSPRFVFRLDSSSLVKSPASILDKMVRNWESENDRPAIDFQNFCHEMDDIGRFRVVANFLGDVYELRDALANAYDYSNASSNEGIRRLAEEFELVRGKLADAIDLLPKERFKGERCLKAHFRLREGALNRHTIELQIQTQLQEAWDKKDHFLIYEPRRRGEKVQREHEIRIFAMSELLYLADQNFDELRRDIVNGRNS